MQAADFAGAIEADHKVGRGPGEEAMHEYALDPIGHLLHGASLALERAELRHQLLP